MRWLLRLYPRRWRERYEDEMLALLEQHTVTPATIADLLLGALDAHLHYDAFGEGVIYVINRLRASVIEVFYAFILYGVGWSMLQRINDPVDTYDGAARVHPELTVLHDAMFIVGCLGFLAFLLGGLPLFFIAVQRAFVHRQRNVLVPFVVSVACLLLFVTATATLAAWHPQTHVYQYLIGYLSLSALLLLVGAVAVSLVIHRAHFEVSDLKFVFVFVFVPEVVIVFSMIVSVLSATALLILITVHAPYLFDTQDVGRPMFIIGLLCMVLSSIFAAIELRRGRLRRLNEDTST
ncbi:MAG: hypothetical protein IRZ10_11375 [Thermoflavifilum sp.]|nr:hypothetical protein [Thermoflavifilum sp.]MCL6515003.1 hypothetical protein [Alicyclobacillus sp.]